MDQPQPGSLGSVIRARRIELGLTQAELAERISDIDQLVRASDISRLEHDGVELPRRERLERLSAALDLPIGLLLARSGWAKAGLATRSSHDRQDRSSEDPATSGVVG